MDQPAIQFAFAAATLGKLVRIAAHRHRTRTLRDLLRAIARYSLTAAH